MRMKLTVNRGIAGLALSASVFLGCQDILNDSKAATTAKTQSEESTQLTAQASTQDNAAAEPAKDLPATAVDTSKAVAVVPPANAVEPPKPTTTEPAPAPTATDHAAECKDILAQMQTAKEPLYGDLKNEFGSLNCDLSQSAGPVAPPDSATVCKNLRSTLANMDPGDAKYPSYVDDIATYCTAKP